MSDAPVTGTEIELSGSYKARDIQVSDQGVKFTNFADMLAYSRQMSEAGVGIPDFMRDKPGLCLRVLRSALRAGLDEFALANECYVVRNQLAYQAKAINAIVLMAIPMQHRPKYSYRGTSEVVSYVDDGKTKKKRTGDLTCTVTVTLANGEVIKHTSPKIGQITIQNSPLWVSSERQQLGYYTMRELARLYFPEVILGCYTGEEREAEMKDVTPPPRSRPSLGTGINGGGDAGFSEEHVTKELLGEAQDYPTVPPTETIEGDLLERAEEASIVFDDLRAALDDVRTGDEVDALAIEFEPAIKREVLKVADACRELLRTKRLEFNA